MDIQYKKSIRYSLLSFLILICNLLISCGTQTPQSLDLVISSTTQTVGVGASVQLSATYLDNLSMNLASGVTWESSNPAVATVSTSGLLTAISRGTTDITATLPAVTTKTSNKITITAVQHYLYAAKAGTSIYYAPANEGTGELGAWTEAGTYSGFNNPSAITFNAAGTVAYVSTATGSQIWYCTVNTSTGVFTACSNTSSGTITGSNSLAINPAGTIAYASGFAASNTIYNCPIDATTGNLTACSLALSLVNPTSLKLNSTGTTAFVTLAGATDHGVYRCPISSLGTFSSCSSVITPTSSPTIVTNMTINRAGTVLYFADAYGNFAQSCLVDASTGAPSSCSTKTTITGAYGVALNASETFLYVSNSGSVVDICALDPTTKTISSCTPTTSSPPSSLGGLTYQ